MFKYISSLLLTKQDVLIINCIGKNKTSLQKPEKNCYAFVVVVDSSLKEDDGKNWVFIKFIYFNQTTLFDLVLLFSFKRQTFNVVFLSACHVIRNVA